MGLRFKTESHGGQRDSSLRERGLLRAEAAGLRQENDALTVDSSLETIPLKRFKPCKLPKVCRG